MTRPTDEEIVAQAIGTASIESGSCAQGTSDLIIAAKSWPKKPIVTERISITIHKDGDIQNHVAMGAKWAKDDPTTIVDHTIGQFGGGLRVFVGSREAWETELKRLRPGSTIETAEDEDTAFILSMLSGPPEDSATERERRRRVSSSSSQQVHVMETVQKNSPRHKKTGCGGCTIM